MCAIPASCARIPVTTIDVTRALRELRTRALRDAIRAALGRSPAIAGEGLPARAGVTSVADVRSIYFQPAMECS